MYQDIIEKDKSFIIEQYNKGVGTSTICKKYGCNPATIGYYLQSWGLELRGVKGKFTCKEKHDEIVKLFNEGNSIKSISKIVGISDSCILNYLKKNGYNTSRFTKTRDDKLVNHTQEIIGLYQSGMSGYEIGKKFNCGSSSITQLLNKNNVEIRPQRQYEVVEDFFENIDTNDKAYILGFSYADGNVISKPGKHVFRISICDLDILEDIKKAMGYGGPLYDRGKKSEKHANQWMLQISSEKMCSDLIRWGCVPNKTFKISCIPPIPDEMKPHFIRGYFDGDGSVSKTGIASMMGNLSFLEDVAKFVGAEIKLYDRHPERGTTNRMAIFSKKASTKKFFEVIYGDKGLYLKRKYERFLNPEKRVYDPEQRKERYYAGKG